jgi:hypothetical protein
MKLYESQLDVVKAFNGIFKEFFLKGLSDLSSYEYSSLEYTELEFQLNLVEHYFERSILNATEHISKYFELGRMSHRLSTNQILSYKSGSGCDPSQECYKHLIFELDDTVIKMGKKKQEKYVGYRRSSLGHGILSNEETKDQTQALWKSMSKKNMYSLHTESQLKSSLMPLKHLHMHFNSSEAMDLSVTQANGEEFTATCHKFKNNDRYLLNKKSPKDYKDLAEVASDFLQNMIDKTLKKRLAKVRALLYSFA